MSSYLTGPGFVFLLLVIRLTMVTPALLRPSAMSFIPLFIRIAFERLLQSIPLAILLVRENMAVRVAGLVSAVLTAPLA